MTYNLIFTVNDLKQIFSILTKQISRRLTIIELTQPIRLHNNVNQSLKLMFDQHNCIYNNNTQMIENEKIWAKYRYSRY